MNKRASLNLSIEAIVIVVIAFTVLGLGLGFVKTQIGDIGKTSTSIQTQISQKILDDLREGNKKLSFPADKLSLGTGEESVQAIGIKNTGDNELYLKIEFQVKDNAKFESFPEDNTLKLSNGGTAKMVWDAEAQYLPPGQSKLVKVTITAPSKQGNYLYKIIVTPVDKDGKALEAAKGPYDTQTFFIKTS